MYLAEDMKVGDVYLDGVFHKIEYTITSICKESETFSVSSKEGYKLKSVYGFEHLNRSLKSGTIKWKSCRYKNTKLARLTYPNAKIEDGYIIVERR